MKFFSYESKFSQLLLKLCNACMLNVLWFVCSLPIVTMGAATTALYYACLKIVREEDSHVAAQFFRSFRENFRQATQIWLILLGCGLFLGLDGYILYHLRLTSVGTMGVIWTLALAVVIAAAVVLVIVLEHVFPLLASVENTNRAMLKNAFLIGTHYLFATILVFAVHFAMFFVVVAWFTPLIIFGEGFCALISAWLLNGILIACSGTREDEEAPEALPEETAEAEALPANTGEDSKEERP